MIFLLMIGDCCFSSLDDLSQTIIVLDRSSREGENAEYNMSVQKSKNISMENAIEERAEKCSAYDKKLFTKGRQTTYQDAITTI